MPSCQLGDDAETEILPLIVWPMSPRYHYRVGRKEEKQNSRGNLSPLCQPILPHLTCVLSWVQRHQYQHPAGTSDMKSNSFWPSHSSGSSLARSKPNSTTSDMSTSSSTGSKSMSPPAPPPWFPTLMAMAPLPPRLTGGTRSWFPPPRAEVPKPLGPPPAAGCPPAPAPARFW